MSDDKQPPVSSEETTDEAKASRAVTDDAPVEGEKPDTRLCHACGYTPSSRDELHCPEDQRYLVERKEHERRPKDVYLGRVIANKYPLIGIIADGGMGSVYRAIQLPVGREVALKVIKNTGDGSEQVTLRFEREAAVVAKLSHPNTVTLHDFGVSDDGTLYMVMELVSGRPLTDLMGNQPMPAAQAVDIAASMLDALTEAHKLGLVHRDLKPANVMLATTSWDEQVVKVLDFGVAKVVGGDESATSQLTRSGMVCGTPLYMAPEQTGSEGVDARADIYALGVVLYQCLTGAPPFYSDNLLDLLLAHRQDPPAPMDRRLAVPVELEGIVMKALAKDPADRFPDARSMATALRNVPDLGSEQRSASFAIRSHDGFSATLASDTAEELGSLETFATSREMAAEMVQRSAELSVPGRSKAGMLVAAAAALALGGYFALGGEEPAPPPTAASGAAPAPPPAAVEPSVVEPSPEPAASPAPPPEPTPAAVLAEVLASAKAGDADKSVAALTRYQKLAPELEALATLVGGKEFDAVRAAPTFQAWLKAAGVPGPGPSAAPAEQVRPPKAKRARKRSKAKRRRAPAAKPKAKAKSKPIDEVQVDEF